MQKSYYLLIFIILYLTGIKAYNNNEFSKSLNITNVNFKREEKYFFASGLRRIEIINSILNKNIEEVKNYLPPVIRIIYDIINYKLEIPVDSILNDIVTTLSKDKDFIDLIEVMNVRHTGFYLGTIDKGKIFDFDLNGWHCRDYTMGIERFELTNTDPNEWNWQILKELSGYTTVSPDNLYQSLKEYENKNKYFTNNSYSFLCNNCHDFLKWCLEIISMPGRLASKTTLKVNKDNFTFKTTQNNNEKGAELLTKVVVKGIYKTSTLRETVFGKVLANFSCEVINSLKEGRDNTCKNYDYSGLINYNLRTTDTAIIAMNNENNSDLMYDNNFCFNSYLNDTDNENISDNNLNSDGISGTNSLKIFSIQNIFGTLMLLVVWWMYNPF
ncbi:hypothetical protein U3516DRAFT_777890 [Neocallimastix sp. 'constans']|jgi:uncharacterized protein YlaI